MLFNISSDGPNFYKVIWNLMNENLQIKGYHGLLPFISCTLHVVHNSFNKGIQTLEQDLKQLILTYIDELKSVLKSKKIL